jgi:hypothetical protein
MRTKENEEITPKKNEREINAFPGYPIYPSTDDIYNQDKEVDVDPEQLSKVLESNETLGQFNEKEFSEDLTGSDLDVPGSELDDEQEKNGNEDEENNYYSLGGENHNDLEEDKG